MRAIASTDNIVHWRAVLAGLCANLVGVGLARFAYTPLIPALIAAHWYSASSTVYLGAANLAGYLAGALFARRMAATAGAVPSLRAMMAVATVAFLPAPFRFLFGGTLSGVSGRESQAVC